MGGVLSRGLLVIGADLRSVPVVDRRPLHLLDLLQREDRRLPFRSCSSTYVRTLGGVGAEAHGRRQRLYDSAQPKLVHRVKGTDLVAALASLLRAFLGGGMPALRAMRVRTRGEGGWGWRGEGGDGQRRGILKPRCW